MSRGRNKQPPAHTIVHMDQYKEYGRDAPVEIVIRINLIYRQLFHTDGVVR